MSALEIGQRLVELYREGRNHEAINELYADDVVSVEATDPPQGDRVAEGIDAVRGKGEWWEANHEIHEASVEGPFPHGDDRFCVIFKFDVTNKPMDMRMKMEEIGLYHVSDGKITREEFFYTM